MWNNQNNLEGNRLPCGGDEGALWPGAEEPDHPFQALQLGWQPGGGEGLPGMDLDSAKAQAPVGASGEGNHNDDWSMTELFKVLEMFNSSPKS